MDAGSVNPQSGDVVYDASVRLGDALEAVCQGRRLLCPVCHKPLLVALDDETLRIAKVHPGIYCSTNRAHFRLLVDARK
jgi:hypothetical protein